LTPGEHVQESNKRRGADDLAACHVVEHLVQRDPGDPFDFVDVDEAACSPRREPEACVVHDALVVDRPTHRLGALPPSQTGPTDVPRASVRRALRWQAAWMAVTFTISLGAALIEYAASSLGAHPGTVVTVSRTPPEVRGRG
jgi:hypothetical protein